MTGNAGHSTFAGAIGEFRNEPNWLCFCDGIGEGSGPFGKKRRLRSRSVNGSPPASSGPGGGAHRELGDGFGDSGSQRAVAGHETEIKRAIEEVDETFDIDVL